MKLFIDNICNFTDSPIDTQNENYLNLKNFLCYVSKTNFFELYTAIRDQINPYVKDKLTIPLSLDSSQITKANLQKCVEWVYTNKERHTPSQWQTNDQILDVLYNVIEIIENTPKNQNITIEKTAIYAQ